MKKLFFYIGFIIIGLSNLKAQDSLRIITKITNQIICPNDSNGVARVFAADGYGKYSYKWSNGDTTEIADSLSYGLYYVTVTDTMLTVRIDSVLIFADSIKTYFNVEKDTVCGNDSSSKIELLVYSYGPYTYKWNIGNTENTIDSLGAGTYIVTVTDSRGCILTDSVKIDSVSRRIASATITDATALGVNDGIWNINTSGGVTPFSCFTKKEMDWYDISTIQFTSQNTNTLPPGIYSTTVKDRFCSYSFQDTINESNPLLIDYSGIDTTACKGGTVASDFIPVNGVTPIAFIFENDTTIWLTGDTLADGTPITEFTADASASVNPGTTHNVKIIDSLDRVFCFQWTVTEPEYFLVISQIEYNNVTCHGGNDGSADITVEGGYGNYTYTIQGMGNTGNNVTGLVANNYTWQVYDDNNCYIIQEFTIHEPDPIQGQIEKTDVRCHGQSNGGIISHYSGGRDTLYYNWAGGETSKNLNYLNAGIYYLTITDANGCTKEDSSTILEPDSLYISLNAITNVSCFGYSDGSIDITVNGGINPDTFNWYHNTLRIPQETEDIQNLYAGAYFLEVRDSNSCIDTATYVVTQPIRIQYNLSQKNEIQCNDSLGDILITSPVNINYVWSGLPAVLNDTLFVNNLSSGDYSLRMIDLTGCFIDTNIVFSQPLPIVINAQINSVSCYGANTGSISLFVNGGSPGDNFIFNWSNGMTDDVLDSLIAGNYNVTVTDTINNCESYQSFRIESEFQEPIVVTIDSFKPSCRDSISDGELRIVDWRNIINPDFLWLNTSGDSIGNGTVLNNLFSGIYILQTTDTNNCEKIDTLTLSFENVPCIGVYNVITPNGDVNNDIWIIDNIDLFPDCEIKIYNQYNIIFESVGYTQPWDGTDKNGELVPSGTYFYEILLHKNNYKPYLGAIEVIY